MERGGLSAAALDLLKKHYGNIKREILSSGSQFYSAATTIDKLSQGCYFLNKEGDLEWPDVFKQLKNGNCILQILLNYSLSLNTAYICILGFCLEAL